MQETQVHIIKSKYVGFRIGYSDWMRLMQLTSSLNLSVTDFMHSLIFPALNQYPIQDVKHTDDVKQESMLILSQDDKNKNSFRTNPKITKQDSLPQKHLELYNQYSQKISK